MCFLFFNFIYELGAVKYEGKTYTQKDEVSTGSLIATLLSEIYLNWLDASIAQFLQSLPEDVILVKRYVYDILFCSREKWLPPNSEVR